MINEISNKKWNNQGTSFGAQLSGYYGFILIQRSNDEESNEGKEKWEQ